MGVWFAVSGRSERRRPSGAGGHEAGGMAPGPGPPGFPGPAGPRAARPLRLLLATEPGITKTPARQGASPPPAAHRPSRSRTGGAWASPARLANLRPAPRLVAGPPPGGPGSFPRPYRASPDLRPSPAWGWWPWPRSATGTTASLARLAYDGGQRPRRTVALARFAVGPAAATLAVIAVVGGGLRPDRGLGPAAGLGIGAVYAVSQSGQLPDRGRPDPGRGGRLLIFLHLPGHGRDPGAVRRRHPGDAGQDRRAARRLRRRGADDRCGAARPCAAGHGPGAGRRCRGRRLIRLWRAHRPTDSAALGFAALSYLGAFAAYGAWTAADRHG